jgi:SAM-dependent methyltransferase
MAPSIIWRRLRASAKPLRVLDPMMGSGTTIVASRLCGHQAVGFDTDPLALLIARAWSSDVRPDEVRRSAHQVLADATEKFQSIRLGDAYPAGADEEMRAFVRFWFDPVNRRQLAALSASISNVKDAAQRRVLWCAFSRLIITKQAGVSLAMDVSHSRPHKVFDTAPIKPFNGFLKAMEIVLKASPFVAIAGLPSASVRRGDARKLPVEDGAFDLVITSPPYLNAIDYLRGHKFSLIWMGHALEEIRQLRTSNVGAESSNGVSASEAYVLQALKAMGATEGLAPRLRGMLVRYVRDMDRVLAEVSRVLKPKGEAVLVVGDSTIRGVFVQNSRALAVLGKRNGLRLCSTRRRPLLENRRYLPPPDHRKSGSLLRGRMREEVVLTFNKE